MFENKCLKKPHKEKALIYKLQIGLQLYCNPATPSASLGYHILQVCTLGPIQAVPFGWFLIDWHSNIKLP